MGEPTAACVTAVNLHVASLANTGRRVGSVLALGGAQDEYSEWSKPHGKLKLQNKPIFHAFENAILTDMELVQSEQGGVGHFFESGLWWQAAPTEVHAKSTVVYGSHAKHSAASNSGCVTPPRSTSSSLE